MIAFVNDNDLPPAVGIVFTPLQVRIQVEDVAMAALDAVDPLFRRRDYAAAIARIEAAKALLEGFMNGPTEAA